jgi:hypothetical protein
MINTSIQVVERHIHNSMKEELTHDNSAFQHFSGKDGHDCDVDKVTHTGSLLLALLLCLIG